MESGPVITSKTNARVKALREALSGNARKPGELLGLEGEHLLVEAARSGLTLRTIFVREDSQTVLQRPALAGIQAREYTVLSRDVFAGAVDTASPQGIAAIVEIPKIAGGRSSPVKLVLEGLQDPGNLGTLLRSAEAFGVGQVFVTPDTANQWNPKTVRASAGSVFRVPVERMALKEIKARLTERGVRLVAAVAHAEHATAAMDALLAADSALMVGNEGAGLSESALALADEFVHIPCMTESLNAAVAGSVLMYEAMRQRIAATIPATAKVSR
ncbi:MAG TPA: RNA methyltransferase [Acidobacteriaceae bacterium]|jgi:TrmH family RNA methyltransferase